MKVKQQRDDGFRALVLHPVARAGHKIEPRIGAPRAHLLRKPILPQELEQAVSGALAVT